MSRLEEEEIRRYGCQMVLDEVGGLGQIALREATLCAADEVEALYLAAAGVGALRVPCPSVAEVVQALNPHVAVTVDSGGDPTFDGMESADVVRSSLRALRQLRQCLELG